jgi:hypothetical protein
MKNVLRLTGTNDTPADALALYLSPDICALRFVAGNHLCGAGGTITWTLQRLTKVFKFSKIM